LLADADLALLGDRHPHQPVDARLEVVVELAPELADLDDLAALAVGQAQRAVLTRGPSREIARRRRSSAVSSGRPWV
jgi:hypothetical protein